MIVCAYNEARVLAACLHSLLSQTRPPDEILVVNNASVDETAASLNVSSGTIMRDWRMAKAWLLKQLDGRN